jgi:glutaredoxin
MYRFRNWHKYQSFRSDRQSHWFKMWDSFFHDFHVAKLSDSKKFVLIGLFGCADRDTGNIGKSIDELCHLINCKSFKMQEFDHFIIEVEDDDSIAQTSRGDNAATTRTACGETAHTSPPREEKRRVEKSREEKKEPRIYQDTEFDIFWESYPNVGRKHDENTCRTRMKNLIEKEGSTFHQIIEGLDRAKESRDWLKENGKFICAPLVFLNKKMYFNGGGDSYKIGQVEKMEGLGL